MITKKAAPGPPFFMAHRAVAGMLMLPIGASGETVIKKPAEAGLFSLDEARRDQLSLASFMDSLMRPRWSTSRTFTLMMSPSLT